MISLFAKPRSAGSPSDFNAAQAAGAAAALEFHRHGDTKSAEKMLRKHGLTLEVAEAYMASLAPTAQEAAEPAPTRPAPASTDDATEMIVGLPAGYTDTVEQRARLIALLWAKNGEGWQIESFDKATMKAEAVRGETLNHRPGLQKVPLNKDFTASSAPDLASYLAEEKGLSLIDCNPFSKTALAAAIPPATVALRDRLAQALKVRPWAGQDGLEIGLEFGPLGDEFGITKLTVYRFPLGVDAAKRKEIWLDLMRGLIAYVPKTRWNYDDQLATTGQIVLTRDLDPLLGVLPYPVDAKPTYESIPFGVDENLQPLSLGLLEMNQLLGGLPGGGKSGGITTLLTGISKLTDVALIGIDPKKVELPLWGPRFSRIAIEEDDATDVLTLLVEEMERRYTWLLGQGLKKLTPKEMSRERPLIVVVIDELADLVSTGSTADEKKGDSERSSKIRRLIAKGRASGIVVIAATQKPQSDVVPTALRDLIQLRVAYATTNSDMTDTILGKGMGQMGGLAHEIPAYLRGACYVISESSRTPIRARTYWVPDGEVAAIARSTAHLRVDLPWLKGAPGAFAAQPVAEVTDLGEISLELDDTEWDLGSEEESEPEAVTEVDPAWAASRLAVTEVDSAWAATGAHAIEDEDPFAASAPAVTEDEDPFATPAPSAKVSPARASAQDEDDPFAEPAAPKKVSAVAQTDAFDWDS